MTQISSKSPLSPGKPVETTLGCCNIFWSDIVHIELEQGELLVPEMSYECVGAKGFDISAVLSDFATLLYSKCFIGN